MHLEVAARQHGMAVPRGSLKEGFKTKGAAMNPLLDALPKTEKPPLGDLLGEF